MSDCAHCHTQAPYEQRLCDHCTRKTGQQLHQTPKLYDALEAFLTPATTPSAAIRRTQLLTAPMPVSEAVLSLRGPGGIVAVLEEWQEALHDARHYGTPVRAGTIRKRVETATTTLYSNLGWIRAEWDAAGDLARDVATLHRQVAAVIQPAETREARIRVGNCPAQLADGSVCGAVLSCRPGERLITCRWCGVTWPPATWAELRTWIDHDRAAS